MIENYGVKVPMHADKIKEKYFNAIIERYENLVEQGYSAGIARNFDYSKMV